MAELMCPGCKSTIDPGQPYCPICFSIPVPRPEEAAGPDEATGPAPACVDPDCSHGGHPPATGCRHCGLRPPPAAAVLLFPWGPVPVPAGQPLLVGRENSPLADRLGAYPNVSRVHAEVRSDGNSLTVVDLGSTNGTFLNDERVPPRTPTPARPGDRLRFAGGLTAEVTEDGG